MTRPRDRTPLTVCVAPVLVVLTCLAVGATGCSEGRADPLINEDQIVTPAQLRTAAPDSPGRAVLAWWRNLQLGNTTRVIDGMTPAARLRLAGEERAVVAALRRGAARVRPTILDEEARRGGVTVYLHLTENYSIARNVFVERDDFLALPLAHRARGWLLDDAAWLRVKAGAAGVVPVAPKPTKPVPPPPPARAQEVRTTVCLRQAGLRLTGRQRGLLGSVTRRVRGPGGSVPIFFFHTVSDVRRAVKPLVLFVGNAGGKVSRGGATAVVLNPRTPRRVARALKRCL